MASTKPIGKRDDVQAATHRVPGEDRSRATRHRSRAADRPPSPPRPLRRCSPQPLAAVTARHLRAYLQKARSALSPNTQRALEGDIERFAAWCDTNGLCAIPASAATVVAYIDATATVCAPATVRRHLSSIATVHKAIGADIRLEDVVVQLALRRMHCRRRRRQAQVHGLTWALVRRLLCSTAVRLTFTAIRRSPT